MLRWRDEKIDQLRRLLDLHDRSRVSMMSLVGSYDYDNFETGIVETHDSGDRAVIFIGPKDKLDGTYTVNEDGTTTVTFTLPAS